MSDNGSEILEKAREEFEQEKVASAIEDKEKFLKSSASNSKKLMMFGALAIMGLVVVTPSLIKPNNSEGKKRIAEDGIMNTLGQFRGEVPKYEKPDMPLPVVEDEKPEVKIEDLPLPKKSKVATTPEWLTRKLSKDSKAQNLASERPPEEVKREYGEGYQGDNSTLQNDEFVYSELENKLAEKLEPTVTKSVDAQVLPNRDYLITKGTSIDCTLINAIDTSVEGFVTCRTAHDVYSESGRVLLLERGSKVVGEYRTLGRNQGQPRLFILWTRLTTPMGVAVDLNSAGTDSLGRAGVDGDIENFFWRRFGGAILTSIMQDSVQILGNSINNNSSGSVQISTDNTMRQSEKLVEELLAQHRDIMPRLVKNQGERIRIYVSRDINFSKVYNLKKMR